MHFVLLRNVINRKRSAFSRCIVTSFFSGISGKRRYCLCPNINVLTDQPVFWWKVVFCDLWDALVLLVIGCATNHLLETIFW